MSSQPIAKTEMTKAYSQRFSGWRLSVSFADAATMTSSPLQLLLSAAWPYASVSPRELTQYLKIETPQSSALHAARPTRRGIALRLGEWTEIKKLINDEFPTHGTTLLCFYGEYHQDTLIALQYRE